jgi:hypothetical protein
MKRVTSPKPAGKRGVSEGFRTAGLAGNPLLERVTNAALLNRTQEVAGSSPASSMKGLQTQVFCFLY